MKTLRVGVTEEKEQFLRILLESMDIQFQDEFDLTEYHNELVKKRQRMPIEEISTSTSVTEDPMSTYEKMAANSLPCSKEAEERMRDLANLVDKLR